jgi:Xaa-Pro aminopeptidase
MKNELQELMSDRQVDGILITGPGQHNPAMVYFTGSGNITEAHLFILKGQEPLLVYYPMERDEAARSGFRTRSMDDYDYRELSKAAKGDDARFRASLYKTILSDLGFTAGNLLVYGKMDAGLAYATFNDLKQELPDVCILDEGDENLLSKVMVTKDADEIEHIRRAGQATVEVVGRVADFLGSHIGRHNRLYKQNGSPVTIGEVKSKINLWLAELGMENPEATIFSMGRDAGVPHSTGNPDEVLRLGETIVFDIFPCEAGGGYFYDFTRTWCLGFAPDEAQKLYEDVYTVFKQVSSELKVGDWMNRYQARTCELFEAQGHTTVQSNPKTLEGYVHSLGHGLGLKVHEAPWFRDNPDDNQVLQPNVVFTVEPGLYYPERGMGVRLEDTLWVTPQGEIESVVSYPYDLVIPVNS